jgi:hypothetical protein
MWRRIGGRGEEECGIRRRGPWERRRRIGMTGGENWRRGVRGIGDEQVGRRSRRMHGGRR